MTWQNLDCLEIPFQAVDQLKRSAITTIKVQDAGTMDDVLDHYELQPVNATLGGQDLTALWKQCQAHLTNKVMSNMP